MQLSTILRQFVVVMNQPAFPEELPSGGQIVKGAYKPPHLRNPSKEQSHSTPRTKSKLAPDISDEKYFPSLSAAKSVEPSGAWGRRRRDEGNFEEVRNSKSHSSRFGETGNKATSGTGPSLNLGNKFGALSQDQS
uniref:Uncharacterized protein n=1 Tax=Timema shepardi TaxID=629360 RepID=A0A7R9B6M4_TIMSH|nr:unnamed protein product [Timema shepardi]